DGGGGHQAGKGDGTGASPEPLPRRLVGLIGERLTTPTHAKTAHSTPKRPLQSLPPTGLRSHIRLVHRTPVTRVCKTRAVNLSRTWRRIRRHWRWARTEGIGRLVEEDQLDPVARFRRASEKRRWRRSHAVAPRAMPVFVLGLQRSG